MTPLRQILTGPLLVLTLAAGCSDPANSVPKSSASDPQKATQDAAASAKDYIIRAASRIGFVGSKVTGSHTGGFTNFAGVIKVVDGKVAGTSEIKINMKSTWADNSRLTGHLKSPDFFDVEKFPHSTFVTTSIEAAGATNDVTGNFTLHGVTKSISFPAQIHVAADAVLVKANFAINRKEFGINYPGKANDLIRDNVVIRLDLKATPGEPLPADQIAD